MTYKLEFDPRALKEWKKLGDPIRQQLKKEIGGDTGASPYRSKQAQGSP